MGRLRYRHGRLSRPLRSVSIATPCPVPIRPRGARCGSPTRPITSTFVVTAQPLAARRTGRCRSRSGPPAHDRGPEARPAGVTGGLPGRDAPVAGYCGRLRRADRRRSHRRRGRWDRRRLVGRCAVAGQRARGGADGHRRGPHLHLRMAGHLRGDRCRGRGADPARSEPRCSRSARRLTRDRARHARWYRADHRLRATTRRARR